MNTLDKWFVFDMLKVLSLASIVASVCSVALVIQLSKPVYSFTDVLLILAIGIIFGAVLTEARKRASDYVKRQSYPPDDRVDSHKVRKCTDS